MKRTAIVFCLLPLLLCGCPGNGKLPHEAERIDQHENKIDGRTRESAVRPRAECVTARGASGHHSA